MNLQPIPTIDELLQNVEAVIKTAPATEAPIILGTLERLKAVVWSKLLTEPRPEMRATGKDNLTAQDVAPILNVKPSMVYDLARQKKLKSYKVGKYTRFREADVHEFLAQAWA